MQPRVTKAERKLLLSYQLPHRIHCADIYPITAPNGSTVIIYGHDRGLRIAWRGGRRPRSTAGQRNGHGGLAGGRGTYAEEDEEEDPDCSYVPIIQHMDIEIGSEVLHIALPSSNDLLTLGLGARPEGIVAIASTDGAVRVLSIPLAPPTPETTDNAIEAIGRSQIVLASAGQIPRALRLKIFSSSGQAEDNRSQVLVAFAAQKLFVFSLTISVDGPLVLDEARTLAANLPAIPNKLSFHPSPKSSQVLVSDVSGSVRLFEPFGGSDASSRPGSSHSIAARQPTSKISGTWIASLHAPFPSPSGKSQTLPLSTRRKKILDARYVLGGKRILVLMEDAEWGLWDVGSPSPGAKTFGQFVLRGYLTTSVAAEVTEHAPKPRKGFSRLAPTTPNTRKAKAETLFSGAPKPPGVAHRGGISVSANATRNGPADESVIIWYDSDVYAIPSILSFCQRSTTSDGSFGSLYAPGLAHLSEINVLNENITAIAQLVPDAPSTNFGQMNVQRDLLIATEYRALIIQHLKPPTPSRGLFQRAMTERPASRDQRLLGTEDLGLDGIDRMLDSIAERPRRVGFVE